jgi:Pyruvate/2-oxoacid:ferredoxin oxidoreductase gamma subunit
MRRTFSYNIIVAGLGGQGVNTLTTKIFELCEANGRPCQGAIFKGGAQKAGTIHSELKIFSGGRAHHVNCSNQILKGALDLMLALEPHEGIRFSDFFNERTTVIVNDAPVPFYSERSTELRPLDPIAELKRRYRNVVARNFSEIARQSYGNKRMANVLMLLEAAQSEEFPFRLENVGQVLRASDGSGPFLSKTREGK